MDDYNAPSILGKDVRYVVSRRVFEKPIVKTLYTSEEKVEESIQTRTDKTLTLLTNLMGISLSNEKLEKARSKFPHFDKANLELFILAFYVIDKLDGKYTSDDVEKVVMQDAKFTVFPTLKKYLEGDQAENIYFDLNRYIERIKL